MEVVNRINSALHLAICFMVAVAFRILLILVLVVLFATVITLRLAPYMLAILAVVWLWNHW